MKPLVHVLIKMRDATDEIVRKSAAPWSPTPEDLHEYIAEMEKRLKQLGDYTQ